MYQLWSNISMPTFKSKFNSQRTDIAVNVPIWPNSTTSTHELKLNSYEADIAVSVSIWPNITMSTFLPKFNSHVTNIDVKVLNVAKHDYFKTRFQTQFRQSIHCCKCSKCSQTWLCIHEFKFNSSKADIAVNVQNVAKHYYVNIRMQVQFTQSRYRCKFTNCGQTRLCQQMNSRSIQTNQILL